MDSSRPLQDRRSSCSQCSRVCGGRSQKGSLNFLAGDDKCEAGVGTTRVLNQTVDLAEMMTRPRWLIALLRWGTLLRKWTMVRLAG